MIPYKAVVVPLTHAEMVRALQLADKQAIQAAERYCQDRFGADGRPMRLYNFAGKCGESGVSKHFGVPFDGNINSFKNPDVGLLQVRTTTSREYDRPGAPVNLIFRRNDSIRDIFVLVWPPISTDRSIIIIGWETGEAIKKMGVITDPGRCSPMYTLSYRQVRPIDTLPEWAIPKPRLLSSSH